MGLWPSERAAEKEENKRRCHTVPQGLLSCGVSAVLKSAHAIKNQLGHIQVLKEMLS